MRMDLAIPLRDFLKELWLNKEAPGPGDLKLSREAERLGLVVRRAHDPSLLAITKEGAEHLSAMGEEVLATKILEHYGYVPIPAAKRAEERKKLTLRALDDPNAETMARLLRDFWLNGRSLKDQDREILALTQRYGLAVQLDSFDPTAEGADFLEHMGFYAVAHDIRIHYGYPGLKALPAAPKPETWGTW